MPPETIETVTRVVEAVKETDSETIITQIGEQVDVSERDCDEIIGTFIESPSATIKTITSADECDNKEVVTEVENEMDKIDRLEAVERELIETFVDDEMPSEKVNTITQSDYVESAEGSESKGIIDDDEMDVINQLEELERDCDEMSPETIETVGYGDSVETVEESDKKTFGTQIEEGVHGEMDIDQLDVLESDSEQNAACSDIGTDAIDQREVLESDGERKISCRDIGAEVNVSHVENRNDTTLNRSSGVQPKLVPTYVPDTMINRLRAKGFATTIYNSPSKRKVCNLLLLQKSNTFTQHHVMCTGFPIQVTDIELIALFEKCGQVFILKRAKEGLFFVTYTNTEDADKAVDLFNYRNVHGHLVKVTRYLPLTRLVVKGISPNATKKYLFQRFSAVTGDLQSLQVFNDLLNEGKIRRFCYLIYGSFEAALEAMRRIKIMCVDVGVEFACQQFEWTKTADTLYINNLYPDIDEQKLVRFFSGYGKITRIKLVRNFAKVQFARVEDATRAACTVNRYRLGNANLDIGFHKLTMRRDRGSRLSRFDIDRNVRPSPSDVRDQIPQPSDMCNRNARPSPSDMRDRNPRPSSSDTRDMKSRLTPSDTGDQKSPSPSSKNRDLKSRPSSSDKRDSEAQSTSPDACSRKSRKPNKDTLFLNNLRPRMTASELRTIFSVFGEVMTVDKDVSSAAIKFRKPKDAKRAAQDVNRSVLGERIEIAFVERMETSDTLYVYNMFGDMTTKRLRAVFSEHGEVVDVTLENGVAVVGFRCRTNAERAMGMIDRSRLGTANVEILYSAKVNR